MVAVAGPLAVQFLTRFLLTDTGRIERENDPDCSPGPCFWLSGCVSGNVFGVRSDVADDIAIEIAALAITEPPFAGLTNPPTYLDHYVELLARDAAAPQRALGLICELPHHLQYESRARLIDDESKEGRGLHEFFSTHGLPDGLAELGFRSILDLWRPWCMVLVNGQVASVAFAARISEVGAELGVATVREFRGQGYAAAAAAGWSRLPTLQSRELFYSTDQTNISSQRVIARLGLRLLGASLRLS
jgi:RimJ/RimL family protein N-acetyltransferase